MYEVIGRNESAVRYGHKDKSGVYITDRREDATAFPSHKTAREFAEELNELVSKEIGLRFEAKKKTSARDAEVG